ncbi:MAG TPA: YgiQ family radical SAM protein [Burkholderiaceae bacterium]|nr:YgiQ family radical SAM protein [Burkholderiaceae bacterium]
MADATQSTELMLTPTSTDASAAQGSASSYRPVRALSQYRPYWAKRLGPAKFLPMSRAEMDSLGWDSCDVIIVTGDAYVDHPSFGMALIGRVLEAQGFRVGIIAQPDWRSAESFRMLGRPNLFFGITAGNMDSMINRYTADRKMRSDDAYTPGGIGGHRPDRCSLVYAQRCREAYGDVPLVMGGIEASLRRIAHYDYWQDKVRRSILVDSKSDLLVYGSGERAIVEIAHRLAAREPVQQICDVRGTGFVRRQSQPGWYEIDSTFVEEPDAARGGADPFGNPYQTTSERAQSHAAHCARVDGQNASWVPVAAPTVGGSGKRRLPPRDRTVIRLPAYEQVRSDPVLYAHASRVLHLETNPGNARALVQAHGEGSTARDVWLNPPPTPLTTAEIDSVFDLPYARAPHPRYGDADGPNKIPAWEMIRFSVNIMRGCFGGCTFCSITEHEGRIIQSRSEESVLREVQTIRDQVKGFTGVISDLGGPTANMYRMGCRSSQIEAACRKPSCVYPKICQNLVTDHAPLIHLYRRARSLAGIKKVLIGSGVRYDLALESPDYIRELVRHHVGGYLKIAPEHTESGPLRLMMKPGIGAYDRFQHLFQKFSSEAGKQQYLVPYFIAAHPGTSDEDMLQLALWLKRNGFRADQVQNFYPSPMATATAMYYSGKNPLHKVNRTSENVDVVRGERRRRLHKAFLRYHDPKNWPLLREALQAMGRADLIGNGKQHLVPRYQPVGDGAYQSPRRKNSTPAASRVSPVTRGRILTQHTGLPPRPLAAGPTPRRKKTSALRRA